MTVMSLCIGTSSGPWVAVWISGAGTFGITGATDRLMIHMRRRAKAVVIAPHRVACNVKVINL